MSQVSIVAMDAMAPPDDSPGAKIRAGSMVCPNSLTISRRANAAMRSGSELSSVDTDHPLYIPNDALYVNQTPRRPDTQLRYTLSSAIPLGAGRDDSAGKNRRSKRAATK